MNLSSSRLIAQTLFPATSQHLTLCLSYLNTALTVSGKADSTTIISNNLVTQA